MRIACGLKVTAIRNEGKLPRTAEPRLGQGPKTAHRETRKGYHKKSLVTVSSFRRSFSERTHPPGGLIPIFYQGPHTCYTVDAQFLFPRKTNSRATITWSIGCAS